MRLSTNELRVRAAAFAKKWADAHYEKGETQTFYNEFFEIFGIERRRVARYEEHVKKLNDKTGFIDLLWPKVLLVEQKSAGRDLFKAAEQAGEYFDALKDSEKPRYQLVCDFQNFELLDRDTREPHYFTLAQLPQKIELFNFVSGREQRVFKDQDPVNIKASELMGAIHDALEVSGYAGHDLERFLVRLVFMLFADDTGIFEPRDTLLDLMESRTREDGSDTGMWIGQLFEVLNTPEDQRNKNLDEDLNKFPYVNGDLFKERLPLASFTAAMRLTLIEACRFNWSAVSPAIFGSLFQSVMDAKERRKKGAHYTTEKNILKVIGPLFLDDLKAEFERIRALKRGRVPALEAFRLGLGKLKFLDPACGCGNFLIIAYRELRLLELDVLRELNPVGQRDIGIITISALDVDQFYGIEFEEFPSLIAEVAMWMMDHIMNNKLSLEFGQTFIRIPLRKSPHIRHADALELDWNLLLPAADCSYVLGNPPFAGKKEQSAIQKQQVKLCFDKAQGSGEIDYVACWFVKAARYFQAYPEKRFAFVATNSITQGEQVELIWRSLFERHKYNIFFAHRTFEWDSDAKGGAHVHCVIVGLSKTKQIAPSLYTYENRKGEPDHSLASNINPYLIDYSNVFVQKARTALSYRTKIQKGNEATDWGYLTLTETERDKLLSDPNVRQEWLRPFWGGDELINKLPRYCIWLNGTNLAEVRKSTQIVERLKNVSAKRAESTKKQTREKSQYPYLFGEIRQPTNSYILIPKVSSEKRDYVPIGIVSPDVIVSGSAQFLSPIHLADFAIVTSAIHMSWMRTTGGRTKSDYQYTNTLVYNTFPWPEISPTQEAKISELAQAVLDARAAWPDSTLADLYDPDLMPPNLRKAHQTLDLAVDKLYRKTPFASERERVEHLFGLYEKMVAPLEVAANAKVKKRKVVRS
jgi:hypothetical protein